MLLSLARAILRKAKVVVMDEATANVDFATDQLIQDTVSTSEAFAGCTKLIIAHRIQTIEDSDLIIVLDGGHLAEAGAPGELLADPRSAFAQLKNGQ